MISKLVSNGLSIHTICRVFFLTSEKAKFLCSDYKVEATATGVLKITTQFMKSTKMFTETFSQLVRFG